MYLLLSVSYIVCPWFCGHQLKLQNVFLHIFWCSGSALYCCRQNWVCKYILLCAYGSCAHREPVRYLSLSLRPQSALDLRAGWSSADLSSEKPWAAIWGCSIWEIQSYCWSHLVSRRSMSESETPLFVALRLTKDMGESSLLWKWLYCWMPFPRSLGSKCVFSFFSLSSTFFPPPWPSAPMDAPATRTSSMSPASEASWRWEVILSLGRQKEKRTKRQKDVTCLNS